MHTYLLEITNSSCSCKESGYVLNSWLAFKHYSVNYAKRRHSASPKLKPTFLTVTASSVHKTNLLSFGLSLPRSMAAPRTPERGRPRDNVQIRPAIRIDVASVLNCSLTCVIRKEISIRVYIRFRDFGRMSRRERPSNASIKEREMLYRLIVRCVSLPT